VTAPDPNTEIPPGTGREAALRMARSMLAKVGIAEAALDARILLCEAASCDATSLARDPDHPLDAAAAGRLDVFLRRRIAGEPVFRILGQREFWGLPFRLAPETLEPRPDTEALVALALRQAASRARSARFLDLGTGSGCILLALLAERMDAFGVGLDRSEQAVRTARENARSLALAQRAVFLVGDWAQALGSGSVSGLPTGFDLIVSNPPYIPGQDIAGLAQEVACHDPHRALDGGPDGLAPYRPIADAAIRLLRPGGALVLEHGHDQAEAVQSILQGRGFRSCGCEHDLGGVIRAQAFMRAGETGA
jgi:release factor glutamine methyltransferase